MTLRVKLIPRGGRTGFVDIMDDGHYKIRVKAPPVDGKANKELIRWLSGEFRVPCCDITIASGVSTRRKTLKIIDPAVLPDWFHE